MLTHSQILAHFKNVGTFQIDDLFFSQETLLVFYGVDLLGDGVHLLGDGGDGDPRSIAGGSSKTTVAHKCPGAMEIQKYDGLVNLPTLSW